MGKGHRRCEVCGIKEAWQTGNKLLFSKFPLDPNRCREWLKAVGNEELVHLPIEKLHEQRNVCANHFGKKDFNKKGNRLKRHATPSLNLIALPLTDRQLAEFPQHVYWHSESKESFPTATDQNEDIQELQSDLLPEAVPSTSQQSRHTLMELSQNGDSDDHNYCKKEDFEEITEDPVVAHEHPVDHQYLRPASPPASSFLSTDFTSVNILESCEIPLTSECEESLHVMQIDSLEFKDSTTFSVLDSCEMPLTSECDESLHVIQIDSLETQGIDSDQRLLFDSCGLDHLQRKPSVIVERYRFRRRKQNEDESIFQYISELENISKYCDFKAVMEEHLRDQLIYGLRSEQIRQCLFAEESLDYAKAVEITCAMEAAETDCELTVQSGGKSGGAEVATRVLRGDSAGNTQWDFASNCSVCGSADHWGEGCGQSRFVCGICKQKGHLNRVCPMRPGGKEQGRCDTDNNEGRQLQDRCDADNMRSRQLRGRRNTDNMGSKQLQDRCDTDNMGSKQLQGRSDTDHMISRQLRGRCDTDDKGAHVPAASGVTGQVDLVDQSDENKPPSSVKEDRKTAEVQLSMKGYKRFVIWVDEAKLPMDIDMESFVSSIRKT